MKLIYLAAPIDQDTRIDARMEQNRLRKLLSANGFTVYDPYLAVLGGPPAGLPDTPDARVGQIHDEALARCDGMLAVLPIGVVSIGVPMEIERALNRGAPVAVLGGESSWHVTGRASVSGGRLRAFPLDSGELVALQWLRQAVDAREDKREATGKLPLKFQGADRLAPMQVYPGDAGFDVYIETPVKLEPRQTQDVPCGISIELPEGYWGLLVGRSSVAKQGLSVRTAIIDNGYRGPLFTIVENLNHNVIYLDPGTRLAQLIPIALVSDLMRPVRVERLGETERGADGFGSTGR